MRRTAVFALIVLAAATAVSAAGPRTIPKPKTPRLRPVLLPGDLAPAFEATDITTRGPVALGWDEAKLTLVQFYATECEPCRLALPVVQDLWTRQRDHGLRAIAVLMDATDVAVVRDFLKEVGVTFPVARAKFDTYAVWGGVSIVPMTFLVGQDGKVVRKYIGGDVANLKAMQEDAVAYLEGRPVGPPVLPAETERVVMP